MMIIDFTPASRERSITISKSSEVLLTFREGSEQTWVDFHTFVFLISTVVPAKHRISEVHYSAASPSREQAPSNEKTGKIPPMSTNLKFLNVGSAAALAITVTGIPLLKHGPY